MGTAWANPGEGGRNIRHRGTALKVKGITDGGSLIGHRLNERAGGSLGSFMNGLKVMLPNLARSDRISGDMALLIFD